MSVLVCWLVPLLHEEQEQPVLAKNLISAAIEDSAIVEIERPWLLEPCLVHAQLRCLHSVGLVQGDFSASRPRLLRRDGDSMRLGVSLATHFFLLLVWEIWVWVKIKPPGDRRFWSMFLFTRVPCYLCLTQPFLNFRST